MTVLCQRCREPTDASLAERIDCGTGYVCQPCWGRDEPYGRYEYYGQSLRRELQRRRHDRPKSWWARLLAVIGLIGYFFGLEYE
jgi:hypothetical protein